MSVNLNSLRVLKHKIIRRLKCQKGLWLDRLGYYGNLNWDSQQPVFIVSTGRTGTTFLGNYFFNQFASVVSYHEPQPDFFDLGVQTARGETEETKIKKIIKSNRKWVLKKLRTKSASYYIEANHYLFSLIPILEQVFPSSKFIHIVRDGRDVLRSAFNRCWYRPTSPYDDIKAPDFPDDPFSNQWEDFSRFEKIAWYWQKKDKIICNLLDNENNSQRIYFENIFNKEENYPGMQKILNFLDLPAENFQKHLENKIRSSNDYELAPWQDWSDEKRSKFNRIAGEHLKFHGYSWQ